MKEVQVYYQEQLWGTLLETDKKEVFFEYSPEALKSNLQLSPLNCPLKAGAQSGFPDYLAKLPGFIYDCLPDGWGMLLMDRMFRQNNIGYISPLDRLTYASANMIGALRFEPKKKNETKSELVDLLSVAEQNKKVFTDLADQKVLLSLIQYGGSAHGARPKTLMYYNEETQQVSNTQRAGFSPWIFKFQAQNDSQDACGLEQIYMECAKNSGLDVSDSRYIQLDKNTACFATKRFDIEGAERKHTHTLAGLMHANFRVAGNIDYDMYLRVVKFLTKNMVEVEKAFHQCVFNVVFGNKDDHPKNFSFIMDPKGIWRLAPSYDLTFMPGGDMEHYMAVNGKGKNIKMTDLLELAKKYALNPKKAQLIIDKTAAVAAVFEKSYLKNKYQVKPKSIKEISEALKKNLSYLYPDMCPPLLTKENAVKTTTKPLSEK